MVKLSRRGFIVTGLAAGALRGLPATLATPPARRVVTLVYDKSLGMMRLVDKLRP